MATGNQNQYKAKAQGAKAHHVVTAGLTLVSDIVGRLDNPEPDDRFITLSALTCSLMGEYGPERQERDWAALYECSGINPSDSGVNPSEDVRQLVIDALCREIGKEHFRLRSGTDVFTGLQAVS